MEFKDIKVGDKVRLNQKLTREEVEKQVHKHYLPDDTWEYLQEARTVESKSDFGWKSVLLEGNSFYWPVELFESVKEIKVDTEEVNVELMPYALEGLAKKLGLELANIVSVRVGGSFLCVETRSGVTATLDYYDTEY